MSCLACRYVKDCFDTVEEARESVDYYECVDFEPTVCGIYTLYIKLN